MNTQLTDDELQERVAILKRFRELLSAQRDKFKNYLMVLEQQQASIATENVGALTAHTQIEEQIVTELYTMQKVIDPVETMYEDICGNSGHADIPLLKTDLAQLRDKVETQNRKNRELLQLKMEDVQNQLQKLSMNPYARKPGNYYSNTQSGAHLIDIRQ